MDGLKFFLPSLKNKNVSKEKIIVFIPGGPWISGKYWDGYIEENFSDYNSCRYVLLNHEDRYKRDQEIEFSDLVCDLKGKISFLQSQFEEIILISHSYGAWLTLKLYDEIKIKSVTTILVSMPFKLENLVLEERIKSLGLKHLDVNDNLSFASYFYSIFNLYFFKFEVSEKFKHLSSDAFMLANERILFKNLDFLKDYNFDQFHLIQGEFDIISGEYSSIVSLVPECGHFPMLEQPKYFTDIIKSILSTLKN